MSESNNTSAGSIAKIEVSPFQEGDCLSQQVRDEIARILIVSLAGVNSSNYVLSPNPPSDTTKLWRPSNAAGTEPLGSEVFAYDPSTGTWKSTTGSVPAVPSIANATGQLLQAVAPNEWAVLESAIQSLIDKAILGASTEPDSVITQDPNGNIFLAASQLLSTDSPNPLSLGADNLLFLAVANLISADPGNLLATGSDSLLYTSDPSLNYAKLFLIAPTQLNGGSGIVQGDYYKVPMDTAGIANDVTPDTGLNDMLIGTSGIYQVVSTVSASGAANQTLEFALGLNGVEVSGTEIYRAMSSGGDIGAITCATLLSLSAGDRVSVLGSNTTSAAEPTIEAANLTIHRI